MINAAILGFGIVGSGVADLLTANRDRIKAATGKEIGLKYIVDIREFPDSPYRDRVVHDFSLVEGDKDVSVVIETIGGVRAAYEFTRRALLAGKSVVTSNKELVATHGTELLALARENGCRYLFEASVGGGIPVLKPLVTELAHNNIKDVAGILNGTTNYILTRMFRGGVDFSDALREAQANGYAEADPTADIEGHDACRKIAILGALAFGVLVPTEKIPTEGITRIRLSDIAAAQSVGASIKLLGRAVMTEGRGLYIMVAPHFVGGDSPISHIDDVYNGVAVTGDFVGDVMFYGRGAGSYPTASAVVSDVCAVMRGDGPVYDFRAAREEELADPESFVCGRYLSLKGVDESAIKVVFGEVCFLAGAEGELAFLSEQMSEKELGDKLRRIEACGAELCASIRVL